MATRRHPVRAFLLMYACGVPCYLLTGLVLYGVLRLPVQPSDMTAASTVALYTVGHFLAFVGVPYFLGLPRGARTVRQFLDDIRLTAARPFAPLALLTLACVAILALCQGGGSLFYLALHGRPMTAGTLREVFDLSAVLPPRSTLLFRQMFSSLEEVAFRGVFLTMLLGWHSERRAILISAAAFGILHLPSLFTGTPVVLALGQATWAFLYGLFYGYLFVRTRSLLPPMVIHWLSNVISAPLTAAWDGTPPFEHAVYSVVFGYGLAALLSILLVRHATPLPGLDVSTRT